jgi:hypothetical protein
MSRYEALSAARGLALVAMWLFVASLLWLLHAVAPGVNNWLQEHQHVAGWVQGVGTVAALLIAVVTVKHQIAAAKVADEERARVDRFNRLNAAQVVLAHADSDLNMIMRQPAGGVAWRRWVASQLRLQVDSLKRLGPFDIPDPVLFHQAANLTATLQHALEHVQLAQSSTDDDLVRRELDAAMRMVQSAAKLSVVLIRRAARGDELVDIRRTQAELTKIREESGIPPIHSSQ